MRTPISYTPGNAQVIEAVRSSVYEAVLDLLGTEAIVIPLGDPKHGALSGTTVTTIGDEQLIFTASEAFSAFDTPPGSKSIIPVLTLNDVDEDIVSPDNAVWTRALAPASWGAWVYMTDATTAYIFTKTDGIGHERREWQMWLNGSDQFEMTLFDEDDAVTPNASILSKADSAISENTWVFLVATYDGSADASGINLYQDGSLVASTDLDDANFVSMRNKDASVALGSVNDPPNLLFGGKMAGGPIGPFYVKAELTADAVLRLYEVGRRALNL
ncbi:MAG: hypothetical protein QF898_02820 [SAR202 cluster bacterium]|jgi:hypothetical protein|nr:hypothetical protein [SAR202 cluster bacterium]MDP6714464.1 hypothetical protein [SAR202 cluster bacterium]